MEAVFEELYAQASEAHAKHIERLDADFAELENERELQIALSWRGLEEFLRTGWPVLYNAKAFDLDVTRAFLAAPLNEIEVTLPECGPIIMQVFRVSPIHPYRWSCVGWETVGWLRRYSGDGERVVGYDYDYKIRTHFDPKEFLLAVYDARTKHINAMNLECAAEKAEAQSAQSAQAAGGAGRPRWGWSGLACRVRGRLQGRVQGDFGGRREEA